MASSPLLGNSFRVMVQRAGVGAERGSPTELREAASVAAETAAFQGMEHQKGKSFAEKGSRWSVCESPCVRNRGRCCPCDGGADYWRFTRQPEMGTEKLEWAGCRPLPNAQNEPQPRVQGRKRRLHSSRFHMNPLTCTYALYSFSPNVQNKLGRPRALLHVLNLSEK